MVPNLGRTLRGIIAGTFGGVDVQYHGMVDAAKRFERLDQGVDIVPLFEVAIIEPHRAEDVVRGSSARGAQARQAAVDSAMVFGDRLVVVINHDNDAAVQNGGVVEPLECEPARERAVANYGDDIVVLAGKVARLG